jgi:hypothetical protein
VPIVMERIKDEAKTWSVHVAKFSSNVISGE